MQISMPYSAGQVLAYKDSARRACFVIVREVRDQSGETFVGMERRNIARRKFFISYSGRRSSMLKDRMLPLLSSSSRHHTPKRISLLPEDLFGNRIKEGMYVYASGYEGITLGKVTKISLLSLKTIFSSQFPDYGYYKYEIQPLDGGEIFGLATYENILVMDQAAAKEVEGLPLEWQATVIGFPNRKFSYKF